jgi:hypothetical protein
VKVMKHGRSIRVVHLKPCSVSNWKGNLLPHWSVFQPQTLHGLLSIKRTTAPKNSAPGQPFRQGVHCLSDSTKLMPREMSSCP